MPSLLITNIKGLAGLHPAGTLLLRGNEMAGLPVLEDAYLLLENGRISGFGEMRTMPEGLGTGREELDAQGRYVLPAWCDSHTHLVFAASREEEFVMKIRGRSYEEIAAAGGGILNSAGKVRQAGEDELFESARQRLDELMALGTGAIEIKSGYGLTADAELKMLRVIRRLKEAVPIPVKATFLGAHAYPAGYRADHAGYLKILKDLIPRLAGEGLADYIDVFCESGFFSLSESLEILEAGARHGLKPKIHVNQLSVSGGVQLGVAQKAVSVDHLEMLDQAAIDSVAGSGTVATLLPGCSLFLGIPFADARRLIGAGAAVAVASDYNPGSAPSGNMNLVVSLACIRLRMLPEEALNAATLNGAAAMELSDELGSIAVGKRANLIVTKQIPSLNYLPYAFGSTLVDRVIINGNIY
ncbi:MAG TPA: imidazolonepropionase [Sphingobacteriaceae bacterium]